MTKEQENERIETLLKPIVGEVIIHREELEDYERLSIEIPRKGYKRLTPFVYADTVYRFFVASLIGVISYSQNPKIPILTEESFIDIVLDAYEKAICNQENEELLKIIDKLINDATPVLNNLIESLK